MMEVTRDLKATSMRIPPATNTRPNRAEQAKKEIKKEHELFMEMSEKVRSLK